MEEKNEDFDQKRFLIAMVLSGAVLLGWQYFFPPAKPTGESEKIEKVEKEQSEKLKSSDDKKEDQAEEKKVDKKDDQPEETLAQFPKSEHTLLAKQFQVSISSIDASISTAHITTPSQYQAAKNLLEGVDDASRIKPFSITFEDENINLPLGVNWEFVADKSEKAEKGDGYKSISYRFKNAKVSILKTYSATDLPYVIDLDVKVENLSGDKLNDTPALSLVGYDNPEKEKSFLDFRPDVMEALCKSKDDIERALPKSLEKESKSLSGSVTWAGVNRRYIALLAAPKGGAKDCKMTVEDKTLVVSKITNNKLKIGPGSDDTFSYTLFIGPKNFDSLTLAGSQFQASVDYGMLTVICRPLRWALIESHDLTGNWGWAIILLTFIIRVALWPVNKKVYSNSEGMKEIQPELAALKEKYKNDQKRLSEETMKLFRENGVSMLGCAPMLIQMPILLAFYWTILYSAEIYHADWAFWYHDLSASDPYYVLPVLMGATMFLQQMMMPTPAAPDGANANMMKTMMKIMPLTMTAFMLFLPAGVNLYYFLSLLIGVIQQYLIKKSFAKKKEAKTT